MRFPITMSFIIRSKTEYDGILKTLDDRSSAMLSNDDPDAISFTEAIESVKIKEVNGEEKDLPDAYLEVGGNKIAQGTVLDMTKLFEGEIAAHSATVVLYQRDKLKYKQIRTRRQQR